MIEYDGIARSFGSGGTNIVHDSHQRNYFAYVENVEIKEQSGNNLLDFQIGISTQLKGNIRVAENSKKPYWLENNSKFWTKINLSANSLKRVCVFMGNFTASNESDGTSVFIFFDDFNDNTKTDWYLVKDYDDFTETNQRMEISIPADPRYDTIVKGTTTVSPDPFIIEYTSQTTGFGGNNWRVGGFAIWTDSSNYLVANPYYNVPNQNEGWLQSQVGYGFTQTVYLPASTTDPHNYTIIYDGSIIKAYKDGVLSAKWSGGSITGNIRFGIEMTSSPITTEAHGWWDNWRVRKFVSTEPSVTVLGERRL